MKRSILFGLAGFGLASILFALVAFVGVENESKQIITMRVMDSPTPMIAKSGILITYPDGKIEYVELAKNNVLSKDQSFLNNSTAINSAINSIVTKGYKLTNHGTAMGDLIIYETYIFEQE